MNPPKYTIEISKEALKNFKRLSLPLREKIWLKAKSVLENNPFPQGNNPKKLKNTDVFRLRIGNYRLVYSIENKVVRIFIFKHRKDVYKNF